MNQSIQSISWHMDRIRDLNYSLNRKRKDRVKLTEQIKSLESEIVDYEGQVLMAKMKHKPGFERRI